MSSAAVSAVATPRALKFNPRSVAGDIKSRKRTLRRRRGFHQSGAWLERLAGQGFHGDSAQSLPADDKWFRVFRAAGSPPHSQTSDSRGTCQSAALEMTLMFLRYAKIAYNAVRYLTADTPPDPARKPVYAVVIPNVNRQLIDILSTLVFMLDDLVPRHNWYERSGYRGTGGHDLR